jgi:phosphoribosyl-ATP pyrophosphohydrolase
MSDLYAAVTAAARWLDEHNGTGREENALRILKIGEEFGEAVTAWIGTTGQNPRKGITHTTADVAAELADVAITALVAIASLGHDPAAVMEACAGKVLARIQPACALCGDRSEVTASAGSGRWVCTDSRACDERRTADHIGQGTP